MFAIKTAKKKRIALWTWEPFAVLTNQEMLSSASWQKLQYTAFIRMIFKNTRLIFVQNLRKN